MLISFVLQMLVENEIKELNKKLMKMKNECWRNLYHHGCACMNISNVVFSLMAMAGYFIIKSLGMCFLVCKGKG
jgi:hypothetical protein